MSDPSIRHKPRGARRMRWVFVAICAVLSTVLAGSMLSNFLGARQLSDTVVRGQTGMLFHLLHRYAPPGPRAPDDASLRRALEAGAELGLTYAALVSPRGTVVEVGESTRELELRDAPVGAEFERIGGVVRAWSRAPPPPPRHRPPGPGGHRSPPNRSPPRGGRVGPPPDGVEDRGHGLPRGMMGRAPRFVIEFVPTQAQAMADRARTDLFVGLGAVVVLWVGAFAFWKLSARATEAESELSRKQHLAVLGEMSAVIAHELRNPLASLKGHAQLLLEQVGEEKLQRKAKRVVDEAVRLQALTSGLLDFVRSGRVQPDTMVVGELVREAVAGTLATVEVDLEGAPRTWSFDRARMRQVIVNLLDNAHHAAPETAAELRVRVQAGALVLEVRDWGVGVPKDKRVQVFEPFHTGRTQGTGLGLAVCQRIVQEHGGTLRCDEHPDGGALFTVTLP
ncbi:MAG: HAMP domain-containing histidine kinase [Nannocystaceae bacterium]|nr:HAMP domain-containing histidine kinase [Nannocystaceae bacterium]